MLIMWTLKNHDDNNGDDLKKNQNTSRDKKEIFEENVFIF